VRPARIVESVHCGVRELYVYTYQQAGNFNFTPYTAYILLYTLIYHLIFRLYTGYISVWTHTDVWHMVFPVKSSTVAVATQFH
jgi:hypothetical protein